MDCCIQTNDNFLHQYWIGFLPTQAACCGNNHSDLLRHNSPFSIKKMIFSFQQLRLLFMFLMIDMVSLSLSHIRNCLEQLLGNNCFHDPILYINRQRWQRFGRALRSLLSRRETIQFIILAQLSVHFSSILNY